MNTGIRLTYSNEKSLYLPVHDGLSMKEKVIKTWFHAQACGNTLGMACPKYKTPLKKRFHVLADFLIGAHALRHADCIISRDLRVYKTYLRDLRVVSTM